MTDAEFREAYRGNKDVLYRFVRRMAGSAETAEDVVQEAFLAFWHNPSAYQPGRGTLRSYLLGIARNLTLRRLRKDRPYDELDEDSALVAPIDPAGMERGELIARAVAALPPLQREAIILAEYEEMSLEEIGRATHSELTAVKSRLHRGRVNLRRTLAPLLETKSTTYGTKG